MEFDLAEYLKSDEFAAHQKALAVRVSTGKWPAGYDDRTPLDSDEGRAARAQARAERNLDARARRAAKANGFIATKTRRSGSFEFRGGFQILDAFSGFPVFGFRYELTAQDVIDYFNEPA